MIRVNRVKWVIVFGALCCPVLFASLAAWACTPQTPIAIMPNSGYPGSQVEISGASSEIYRSNLVEIRWNSINGPVLGSAAVAPGQAFSIKVTVPEAPPGVYYPVLVTGGSFGIARAPFEIIPSTGPANSGTLAIGEAGRPSDNSFGASLWEGFRGNKGRLANLEPQGAKAPNLQLGDWAILLTVGVTALFAAFSVTLIRNQRVKSGQTGKAQAPASQSSDQGY